MTILETNRLTVFKVEDNFIRAYMDIHENARKWLSMIGCTDLEKFSEWLIRGQATIVKFPGGYIVVDEFVPEVRATLHPVFTDKRSFRDMDMLKELRSILFQLTNVRRLQVRVSESAGILLRKRLQALGFSKEATLRNYMLDRRTAEQRLMSIDIWVIFK